MKFIVKYVCVKFDMVVICIVKIEVIMLFIFYVVFYVNYFKGKE